MKKSSFIDFSNVEINDGFWHARYMLNRNVSVENVMKRFEETGRMDALRFNFVKTGERPHIFYDSDVAKWIEAVAYLYIKNPEGLDKYIELCEELIDSMEKNQRDDGYLNSTHQQITPKDIFRKRANHELYCAGHLIEAAVAYHTATGRDKFLKIMEKYCDCIYKNFIENRKTEDFITPGHEEIELALMKLYAHTGNEKYFEMAKFFLVNRGKTKEQLDENINIYTNQDNTDIYNLKEAEGHGVRALYFYSGIADLAKTEKDEALLKNLSCVFDDIRNHKMYITGGVGSTHRNEGFTKKYDLPNMTAYSESCCAIAMIMFVSRMRMMERNSKYGNMAERVLYNLMLSSTSLSGKAFFYENPLEIALEDHERETAVPVDKREHLAITERQEAFGCSCCPPNINRFFAELGSFIALEECGGLCVEQYIPSAIKTSFGGVNISGEYALSGKVEIKSDDYTSDKLCVRIPEWSKNFTALLNGTEVKPETSDGYAEFKVGNKFKLELDFNIMPRFIAANPKVRADVGRVALTFGPVVYCLEGADNGERLNQIEIDTSEIKNANVYKDFHGLYSIEIPAYRLSEKNGLYFDDEEISYDKINAKFIPYFAFANRGTSDMLVWVRKH